MSYEDDQIKLLNLICFYMLPADFSEHIQNVTLYEDDFKQEGFLYNEAVNVIKEMWRAIEKFEVMTSLDGKRGITIYANNNVHDYLHNLKYPRYEMLEENDVQFSEIASKISIIVDSKKGIFRVDRPELRYPLGRTKKRMKLIKYLLSHKQSSSLSSLMAITNQSKSAIITAINGINSIVTRKLDTAHNLISHLEEGGYQINKEVFRLQEKS